MIHSTPQGKDSVDKSAVDTDESAFNETLKRMLKTPPKPHEKSSENKPKEKKAKRD